MVDSTYIGNELTLFKDASNWKNYWHNAIQKFIKGDLLEVGAGIGVNTNIILQNNPNLNSVLAIEPDQSLANQILDNIGSNHSKVTVISKYLDDLPNDKQFDTIIYIDVIEHIEDDSKELNKAKSYLKDGGCLIILVPAYNFLFSPFDRAVGHYRRYNKKMLLRATPKDLTNVKLFYLDSLGVCASIVNKVFLKKEYPTKSQVLKWDKLIVPVSKITDKIVFNSIGKSLVGIWRK